MHQLAQILENNVVTGSVRITSHHFKQPPHQEPFTYPWRPWEVELVAQSGGKYEVVHVCRQSKRLLLILIWFHFKTLLLVSMVTSVGQVAWVGHLCIDRGSVGLCNRWTCGW